MPCPPSSLRSSPLPLPHLSPTHPPLCAPFHTCTHQCTLGCVTDFTAVFFLLLLYLLCISAAPLPVFFCDPEMFFAPPAKVPRTQRLTVTSSAAAPYVYKRVTEADSGLTEASPTSLDGAVVFDAANGRTIPVSSFLSGAGAHLCWMVDENTKLLRLWNVSRPGWRTAAPRLAEIPYFAAATEGLPMFVSEMGGEEESLAFCSERGAIASLDHSIEVQMIDEDDAAMMASSFVCARRWVNAEAVIVTVLGTTAGVLVVDLKYDGTHTTMRFDRRDPASFRWVRGGRDNLLQRRNSGDVEGCPATPPPYTAEEEGQQQLLNEDAQTGRPSASANVSSWLWHSLKSLVASGNGTSSDRQGGWTGPGGAANVSSVWPLSAVDRGQRGDSPLAFTHVQLRYHYPDQVVAISALGEVFLLDFSPVPPLVAGTAPRPRISIKWATSLPSSLGRSGRVVACTESQHKVCVLYYVRSSSAHPLPALWLVTLDASLGKVVNYVVLNAVADVVSSAARLPSHHVKLFSDDTHCVVLISIGAYVLRVNNQVGVRQPCSSEDTICFAHLEQAVVSLLREDGSLVTLDARGPHLTVRDALAARMVPVASSDGPRRLHDGDDSGESELKSILDAVRTDPTLSLDSAVLYASESLSSSSDSHYPRWQGSGNRGNSSGVGTGNWARRNLNTEDKNIVQRVTRQLTCQQQAHRCFLMAVLRHEEVRKQLSQATIAQMMSVQEALVSLCALRSMQNVGLQAQQSLSSDPDSVTHRVLPPLSDMLGVAPSGGCDGAYLLPRRPYRHDATQDGSNDASGAQAASRLVKSTEQIERCQQIMRRAIVAVADAIRAEQKAALGGASTGLEGSVQGLTAAEVCFADPSNLARLLCFVGVYLSEVRQTVSLPLEEKFAECYAAGCIYVVVAQSIMESREETRSVYEIPKGVLSCMWTGSSDPVRGIALCFSQACVHLSNTLADVCDVASSNMNAGTDSNANAVDAAARLASAATLSSLALQKCDMLDVVTYLLYFFLTNNPHHDSRFVSSVVTNTLLREPFLNGPVGYPYGAPAASRGCVEVGLRVLRVCETLALRFDAMPILMTFALSTPIDDPASCPEQYERLQSYCQQNSLVLDAALQTLWEQRREWELLSLPAVLPGCPDARARRNSFLEAQAPHLLWLADPGRYDALTAEGQASPPYIPYGEDQLKHRSRCNAMARLAWVATGAAPSSRINDVELSESIVAGQQEFLGPDYNAVTLGAQAAVQRLLEKRDCVAAWVQAAVIASHTMQPTSEDLLVQVLRRCRAHDGESCLRSILANSVSELETDANLRQTALGQVIVSCVKLQDTETLYRVCETLLTAEELTLLSSWVAYLWTASHERA
ncbi:conserved hypothetical protein [Leishmania braziliensis MHOM/BR/75/M2904]|uniref:Uncharacterized protein n=2 Tax=Leishmania braziliensis TaxID=5660 RepID=A4HC87_LEIBR|nr:conserved hypothetical protein [Leishmania braziliensis MHOM/BR/75/M2904]CAJ2472755.1 unnamed protein product [Leishmania braziliensis]CAM45080.1 conserved hypothetical protein [Leishmania braziliensis MHOM/BR/75/M2904]